MGNKKLSLVSIIKTNKDVISSDMNGDIALLKIDDRSYYHMNKVGARIWNVIQEPKAIKDLIEIVENEYDIEKEQCKDDIINLLQELLNNELIIIIDK